MVSSPRGGFTLVEAIIALTLSSFLVILVGGVFLVQNQYYAVQLARTAAQDNARMMTELVASELRSLTDSAVFLAESTRLAVRAPIVMGAVCGRNSPVNRITVYWEGGQSELATGDVGGFAVRESLSNAWGYFDISSWSDILQSTSPAPTDCFVNGADTVGARATFTRLKGIHNYTGSWPPDGTLMMLYRKVEYRIQASTMDPSTLALYRGLYGGTLVEAVTGLDASSGFQYRTGGSTYSNTVTGASLGAIDAIRIGAQARTRPQTGATDDVTFGWAVNVILRNNP